MLDVYGSYREMGRKATELLGEDGRRVYDLNLIMNPDPAPATGGFVR